MITLVSASAVEWSWSDHCSSPYFFLCVPIFSFCFQLSLCLNLPVVSNVCNCGICLMQSPWFLAVDKECFCTQWSWAGNALVQFPGSKSGCSVIHLCQQFQVVRMEIGDNRTGGKFQFSPSALLLSPLGQLQKRDNERNHCGNFTVPEVFPCSGTILLWPAALLLITFYRGALFYKKYLWNLFMSLVPKDIKVLYIFTIHRNSLLT